jgi:hypothetical protein
MGFPKIALSFYVLAICLGLLLRTAFLQPIPWLNFGNALHAHSHTLYFGWAGLGLTSLAFERIGAADRAVKAVLWGLVLISVGTFAAFLHSGYALPGIVVSSASLVVWAAAVVVWWRRARGQRGLELAFLRAGMIYVLLAICGAIARVVLLATKWGTPFHAQLSVYGFLHAFAWFFLFTTMALLIAHLRSRGVKLDERALRTSLKFMALTAWIGAPLGVIGGDVGPMGAAARLGALIVATAGIVWVRSLWRASNGLRGAERMAIRSLAGWYALKVSMEGAGAFGLAAWAAQARHPAILYLHVMLVGFVSLGLMIPVLERLGRPLGRGLWLHNLGLLIMAGGLALLGAGVTGLPLATSLIPFGYQLAALGAVPLVLAGALWLFPLSFRLPLTSLFRSTERAAR